MILGWEFLILNPFDKNITQSSQKLYNKNYNDSYYKFIKELCIPNPKELFVEITFLKSVFLKTKYKYIRRDIQNYYEPFGINVRNLYQSGEYIFLIIEHIS